MFLFCCTALFDHVCKKKHFINQLHLFSNLHKSSNGKEKINETTKMFYSITNILQHPHTVLFFPPFKPYIFY